MLLLAALGLHCYVGFLYLCRVGGQSSLQGTSFLLQWLLSVEHGFQMRGLPVVAVCGLRSHDVQIQLFCDMWDLSRSRIEPISLSLAGGSLTTRPPEKTPKFYFYVIFNCIYQHLGLPCGLAGKEYTCNMEDLGLIPGLERSAGKGNSYPLQYFSLENPIESIGLQRVGHN